MAAMLIRIRIFAEALPPNDTVQMVSSNWILEQLLRNWTRGWGEAVRADQRAKKAKEPRSRPTHSVEDDLEKENNATRKNQQQMSNMLEMLNISAQELLSQNFLPAQKEENKAECNIARSRACPPSYKNVLEKE